MKSPDDNFPPHESTLIRGNSLGLIDLLEEEYAVDSVDEIVDVTITSPPYADMKTYEADKGTQIGVDESYEDYLKNLKSVFEDVYGITKESGTLWVVVNTFKKDRRMVDLPGDIIDICTSANVPEYCPHCAETDLTVPVQASADGSKHYCSNCERTIKDRSGWLLQDIVIWDKKRALPFSSKGSFRNVFEYILCFSKTKSFEFNLDHIRNPDPADLKEWWVNYPERYHPRGKLPDNIWSMVTPSQGAFADSSVDHPAPFPPELVERILDLTTTEGSIVLDPFAGSGTVCAQACTMDRHAIGIELSEIYLNQYETLYKEISERWEEKIESADVRKVQQEEFTKVISGLRQIRYCKELLRWLGKKFNTNIGNTGVECILHKSNEIGDPTENPQAFIDMDLEILYNEHRLSWNKDEFRRSIETIKQEPPCNSFGINANVNLTNIREKESAHYDDRLYSSSSNRNMGFLYKGGCHNQYDFKSQNVQKLIDRAVSHYRNSSKAFPPVVSNVKLDVPQPKKYCMECGDYEYTAEYSTNNRAQQSPQIKQ